MSKRHKMYGENSQREILSRPLKNQLALWAQHSVKVTAQNTASDHPKQF